jgi:hypothetical protein
LQPKKAKIVNPWIHEQTHHEYLENIIVSNTQFCASCALLLSPNRTARSPRTAQLACPSEKALGLQVSQAIILCDLKKRVNKRDGGAPSFGNYYNQRARSARFKLNRFNL